MSEQEQLARLVRNQDMEPLDSASMLFDRLRERIGDVSEERLEETKREIAASGAQIEGKKVRKFASGDQLRTSQNLPDGYSTEKVLISLYEIRDCLIDTFQSSGVNSSISKKVVSSIEKVDVLIKTSGGEVDRFDPLNHCSGLQAPNSNKSAEKVIETTIQCYALGKVEEAKIADNGKTINIAFSGTHDSIAWKAIGTVKADEWTGNEAIDYVYTPREGHMSVKAYDNGRWADRNSSGKYKIHWDLEEKDISKKTKLEKPVKQAVTIDVQNKEGDSNKTQNNNNDGDEEIGSPIKSS